MADIRINSLSTTASSTASDDFLAVDGTTNGTRKLSAFSPSFGGKVAINGGDTSSAYLGLAGVAGSLAINFTNANTTGQSFGIRGFAGTNSSDYVLNLRNAADSATLLKVDGVGGTTVGGVLTLTSTDAKLLLNASGVATQKSLIASNGGASVNYNGLYATSNWTDGNAQANSSLSSWRVDVGGFDAFTFGSDQFAVGRAPAGSTTFSKLFTVTSNGNVLVGTSTNSSNGIIQLATHTTSAGGIGFGTETSVYRAAAGSLVVDHIGGSAPTLNLSANGSIQSRFFFNGTNTFLESYTSHSLILRTNQTTALTLDSSQNATFAGTASLSTTTDRAGLTINFPVGATGSNGPAVTFKTWTNSATLINAGRIASIITDGLASYASKLEFSVANAGSLTTALTIESNSNATFAGSIKTVAPTGGTAKFWELGEAATVSPTSPNRTIRVEIDGTVYYLHAKTTND
jgi:hypothetical protein